MIIILILLKLLDLQISMDKIITTMQNKTSKYSFFLTKKLEG